VRKGGDVYLFLTGMMLIAELARREGLFDWLAALAVEHAHGSPQRLFTLVYAVGTVVPVRRSSPAAMVVSRPRPRFRSQPHMRGRPLSLRANAAAASRPRPVGCPRLDRQMAGAALGPRIVTGNTYSRSQTARPAAGSRCPCARLMARVVAGDQWDAQFGRAGIGLGRLN